MGGVSAHRSLVDTSALWAGHIAESSIVALILFEL